MNSEAGYVKVGTGAKNKFEEGKQARQKTE